MGKGENLALVGDFTLLEEEYECLKRILKHGSVPAGVQNLTEEKDGTIRED